MNNAKFLGLDYVTRSRKRLVILKALEGVQAWADIVREAQEIVELALKGVLKTCGVEAPRTHDVSQVLRDHVDRLPAVYGDSLDEICEISRSLRKDRELAYYGADDLLPGEFFNREDAELASAKAMRVVELSEKAVSIHK